MRVNKSLLLFAAYVSKISAAGKSTGEVRSGVNLGGSLHSLVLWQNVACTTNLFSTAHHGHGCNTHIRQELRGKLVIRQERQGVLKIIKRMWKKSNKIILPEMGEMKEKGRKIITFEK